ncbi:MAG: Xanthine dehydrogenase [Firmicutes bacterium]|nr:Xanthine dehydrogenase [Bacillota bacterium]
MAKQTIKFFINEIAATAEVETDKLLVDFLREDLAMTGTKKGCGVGECGACTVIIDGRAVNSCMVLAATIDGSSITTIEGVNKGEQLHRLQQSFIDHGAVQCGFCTPGMILSAKALLDSNPKPTEQEIKTALSGNLCRCTGYHKIVAAVTAVSEADCGGEKNE